MKAKARKNRKLLVPIAILVTLLLAAGATWAWFVSRADAAEFGVTLGSLRIETQFDSDYRLNADGRMELRLVDDDTGELSWVEVPGFEPGDGCIGAEGSVTNVGNLSLIARYNLEPAVWVRYADDDMTPASPDGERVLLEDVSAIPFVVELDNLLDVFAGSGDELEDLATKPVAMWDGEGRMYLMMSPEAYADILIGFDLGDSEGLDGIAAEIGNRYQDCLLQVEGEFLATQLVNGAMRAEFGITLDDLSFENPNAAAGRSARSSAAYKFTVQQIVDYLNAI